MIRVLLFFDGSQGVVDQVFLDITKDSEHFVHYLYMGGGTAVILALLGFMIGKNGDELRERARELDVLHREVAEQKEIFENRYKVLDRNIKNFHQISSKIQKSLNLEEVLLLCAEGLHDVLGYERVNILIADEERRLRFVTSVGSEGFDPVGVALPTDESSGIIGKCFNERKVFLVDDISLYPEEYHLIFTFPQAMNIDFKCPDCQQPMGHFDNEVLLKALKERIGMIKKSLGHA